APTLHRRSRVLRTLGACGEAWALVAAHTAATSPEDVVPPIKRAVPLDLDAFHGKCRVLLDRRHVLPGALDRQRHDGDLDHRENLVLGPNLGDLRALDERGLDHRAGNRVTSFRVNHLHGVARVAGATEQRSDAFDLFAGIADDALTDAHVVG